MGDEPSINMVIKMLNAWGQLGADAVAKQLRQLPPETRAELLNEKLDRRFSKELIEAIEKCEKK